MHMTTKILIIFFIFSLFLGRGYCQIIGLELDSDSILTLIPPDPVSYGLKDPLNAGVETLSENQTVLLTGNQFNNTTDEPYISASITGEVNNAFFTLSSIDRKVMVGRVTVNNNDPAQVILSDSSQGYAKPDVNQISTSGTIRGSHRLIITKSQAIPAGTYEVVIVWTASDGGAGTPPPE